MNRRGFLGSILAAAAAPAIVRADSLMRLVPMAAPLLPLGAEFVWSDPYADGRYDEFIRRAMERLAADIEFDLICTLQKPGVIMLPRSGALI